MDPEAEVRNAPFGSGKNAHDDFMAATHTYCEQRGSGIYPDWVEHGMKSLTGQGLFDERLSVPEVMAAARNLRENPEAARIYRQRLLTPGQVADSQFVSNLEYTALSQAKRPRRYAKVPRYRGTRYAKK